MRLMWLQPFCLDTVMTFLRSVIQSFVDSGVVHVICVAGLHVGILYSCLLATLLSFRERIKYGKLMSVILILLLFGSMPFLPGLRPLY